MSLTASSVKNDLETVNNRNSGGNNGGLPISGLPLGSLREKEAFLIPGGQIKVSNKDAALAEKGAEKVSTYKNKMADYNLVKEDDHLAKNKFDL